MLAALVLAWLGRGYPAIWLQAGLLGAYSSTSAVGWSRALEIAASGRSEWLSAVTLTGSVVAVMALIGTPTSYTLSSRVTVLCTGLFVGSVVYLFLISALTEPTATSRDGTKQPTLDGHGGHGTAGWFLASSATGYGAGVALQSAAATLPANGLSVISVAAKLVAGFATVVTNTTLPRLVHTESDSEHEARRYMWAVLACVGFAALFAVPVALAARDTYTSITVFALAWILATATSATLQRLGMRFLPASANLASILVAIAVPAATLVYAVFTTPTIGAILAAYVFLDVAIAAVYSVYLRQYALGAISTVCSAALVTTGILLHP